MLRFVTLAILIVAWGPASTASPGVPVLKAGPSCRAESSLADGAVSPAACMRQELQARTELRKKWTTFATADRANCLAETNTGGPPSYVELLTCLQMARDARVLEKKYRATTGHGDNVISVQGR